MLSNKLRSLPYRLAASAAFLLTLAGCASVQESAFPIGSHTQPAKPSDTSIVVFRDSEPTRPYEEIARLNVHLEKSFFVPSAFKEALPRLEKLPREQGADAIIDVEESRDRLNETFIYNVKAVAIIYTD